MVLASLAYRGMSSAVATLVYSFNDVDSNLSIKIDIPKTERSRKNVDTDTSRLEILTTYTRDFRSQEGYMRE